MICKKTRFKGIGEGRKYIKTTILKDIKGEKLNLAFTFSELRKKMDKVWAASPYKIYSYWGGETVLYPVSIKRGELVDIPEGLSFYIEYEMENFLKKQKEKEMYCDVTKAKIKTITVFQHNGPNDKDFKCYSFTLDNNLFYLTGYSLEGEVMFMVNVRNGFAVR